MRVSSYRVLTVDVMLLQYFQKTILSWKVNINTWKVT